MAQELMNTRRLITQFDYGRDGGSGIEKALGGLSILENCRLDSPHIIPYKISIV
jgi:hypothetical protein